AGLPSAAGHPQHALAKPLESEQQQHASGDHADNPDPGARPERRAEQQTQRDDHEAAGQRAQERVSKAAGDGNAEDDRERLEQLDSRGAGGREQRQREVHSSRLLAVSGRGAALTPSASPWVRANTASVYRATASSARAYAASASSARSEPHTSRSWI